MNLEKSRARNRTVQEPQTSLNSVQRKVQRAPCSPKSATVLYGLPVKQDDTIGPSKRPACVDERCRLPIAPGRRISSHPHLIATTLVEPQLPLCGDELGRADQWGASAGPSLLPPYARALTGCPKGRVGQQRVVAQLELYAVGRGKLNGGIGGRSRRRFTRKRGVRWAWNSKRNATASRDDRGHRRG